jgi:hypothetical protein
VAKLLPALVERGASAALVQARMLPLVPALAPFFPGGALRQGSTVTIGPGVASGATTLALTLLSGPCASGSWCAVVGLPDLGLVAAAQMGVDLERLVVVPRPGPKWAVVTAALLEGLDVVVLGPPDGAGRVDARRLEARARERGAVLVVVGQGWPGADVRLAVLATRWRGLQDGHGYLWGREMDVMASGRGAASGERRASLWLSAEGQGAEGPGAQVQLVVSSSGRPLEVDSAAGAVR